MTTGSSGAPSVPTDAELVVASVEDRDRFGPFYDRHYDAVVRYFYVRTRCAQVAADLTAETFAAAFASRRRFRDSGPPAAAWLFTIARRQLGHYLRRERVADRARRKLGVDLDPLGADDLERIESQADDAPLIDALRRALEALPASQAEAVRLRVMADLPYAEVAARLACTEGAARVRVSRGLATLFDDLGGDR